MSNSPPSSLYRRYNLGQAAEDGMLICCKCQLCRRSAAFVAADLVAVGYRPEAAVEELFDWCHHCGNNRWTSTWPHFPSSTDVARLKLRRPGGVRVTRLWRDEWLELPLKPLDLPDKPGGLCD